MSLPRIHWVLGGLLLAASPAAAQFPQWYGPPAFPYGGAGRFAWGYSRSYISQLWWSQPTIIVVPPPIAVVPEESRRLAELLRRLPQVPPPDEVALLRRAPAPPPPKRDFNAAPPLIAPKPDADKKVEAQRQITLGKDAFVRGEPGLALERFRQAALAAPDFAAPHFLIAQAQLALGRYRESAAAALDGLKRQPNGPDKNVPPRDLYGQDAENHALDLERLKQAAERSPDEPSLAFLYGYQLWINGRRDEARPYLERAANAVDDPGPIRRLLAAP